MPASTRRPYDTPAMERRPGARSVSGVRKRNVPFKIHADFAPAGDQPDAIVSLAEGIKAGERYLTLLGATGTGKTFTVAHVIEAAQKPTLVLAPNKALAAQLASEFREFFPENRVEYFVSYYDYYQPEAYIPQTDTYIEKDSSVNDEIERLRHSATSALFSRSDVIIVASVSAIYGLGAPAEYEEQTLFLQRGVEYDLRQVVQRLVDMQYERNEIAFARGRFRLKGDTLEVQPAYEERAIRVEFFGDEIERLLWLDPLTGELLAEVEEAALYPATHYATGQSSLARSIRQIEADLEREAARFDEQGKLLEAQRLRMRVRYDLEMMEEVGYCSGIENYSRYLDGRQPGERPYCLLDYFPDDYLVVIDESHVAVPQLHGQYEGDRSRKTVLVQHGFRLEAAIDNRPLRFDEFIDLVPQIVFLSATPSKYELEVSSRVAEQIVRPTGLVDPEVIVKPTKGQIDDLIDLIRERAVRNERTLVTTLTKKMAEDLTDYLLGMGLRVRYMHSETDTLERIELLRDLRLGEFDTLVGINLLREGLDLPEVSLVAILDADKEGYLRSSTSLIQTIGRAARNVSGEVVMYADQVTDSMRRAIDETNRRRHKQVAYNERNGINPETIRKRVSDILDMVRSEQVRPAARERRAPRDVLDLPTEELGRLIQSLEDEMREAAKDLRFEYAARLRDEVNDLRRELREMHEATR